MRTLRNVFFHVFFVALALSLGAGGAFAHPRGPNAPYTVSVEDPSGRTLPTYHHGGRTYVLGDWGGRYTIRVENHTARRIEAVVSVDGRDVVTGAVGDYVNGRGYLIDAYDSVVIEGFRQSLNQVAAFRFTDPGNSYSSKMGTPQHVGVIGVAVFPERRPRVSVVRPRPRPKLRRRAPRSGLGTGGLGGTARKRSDNPNPRAMAPRDSYKGYAAEESAAAEPAPSAESRALADSDFAPRRQQQNLGTEYGESRDSQVHEVHFRREDQRHPAQVISLFYDDREGLLSRGIDVDRSYRISRHEPSPFPNTRFAPPPPY